MMNIIYNYYYMILAMDKEQSKELWIRRQAKDRGTIERAINVKKEKSKERWTRKQAMDQGEIRRSDGSGGKL
jgi:hypothetical protein